MKIAHNRRPQRPQRPINVATGRRLTPQKKKSLVKWKYLDKSRQRERGLFTKKYVEFEQMVISPRERTLLKGVRSPLEQPPENMPQSAQDFFMTSRAIRSRAYDPTTHILEIIFTTGYGYLFYNVPYDVWRNFLKAQSAGTFFMDHIYGHWAGPKGNKTYFPNYTYRRIR